MFIYSELYRIKIRGKRMNKRLVTGAIIVLFFSTCFMPGIIGNRIDFKQDETSYCTIINEGTLSGYVTDTSMNPVGGARIRVYFHETYEENYSDPLGYYHVTNIPICYCLKNATASKVGYETEWILLSITENTTHDFVLTPLDPVPDLDCDGTLSFVDVTPGETVTGTFTVENIGEPESLLNWEIQSYPDWGTWTFDPDHGVGLMPEAGIVTVDVEVVAPEDPDVELEGEVVVVNSEDPDDICIIDIACSIPPPKFWYTYIGLIHDRNISSELVTYHADVVFVFWIIFPGKPIIDEEMTLPTDYKGHIGEKFIFARVLMQ